MIEVFYVLGVRILVIVWGGHLSGWTIDVLNVVGLFHSKLNKEGCASQPGLCVYGVLSSWLYLVLYINRGYQVHIMNE